MSPTAGRAALGMAAAGGVEASTGFVVDTETVGSVFLDGFVAATTPARLEWMLEVCMCDPGPGLCDDDVARTSPGTANDGMDMVDANEMVSYTVLFRVPGKDMA